MKKFWVDIFFVIACLLVFLLESGGFGTGITFSFVFATVVLGVDRWGALTCFVGGFLLDLIMRIHFFGLTVLLFLLFNLVFQLVDRYTTVSFWHRLFFSLLGSLIYRLYLFTPAFLNNFSWVFFLRGVVVNFILTWVFYVILSNFQHLLATDSDLQLSLKL